MSLSDAERYARRAKSSSTAQEVGLNTKKSVDELIRVIRDLESRIGYLENKMS